MKIVRVVGEGIRCRANPIGKIRKSTETPKIGALVFTAATRAMRSPPREGRHGAR
jgi:hypothetical protein